MKKLLSLLKRKEKPFVLTFLLSVVICNLAFISLSGFFIFINAQKILTRSALNYTQSIMTQAISNVDFYLSDRIKLLQSLAKNDSIKYCLGSYPTMDITTLLDTEYKFSGFIKSIKETKPDVYDILVIGNNGYIYDSQARWDLDKTYDFTSTEWYKEALDRKTDDLINISVTNLDFYNSNTQYYLKKSVYISLPVYNYRGQKTGVVFFFLGLDEIQKSMLTGKYKEFGDIMLVDTNSSVIVNNDNRLIGTRFKNMDNLLPIDTALHESQKIPPGDYLWTSIDSKFSDSFAVCRISLGYIRKQTTILGVTILICMGACIALNVLLAAFIYRSLYKTVDTLIVDMDSIKSLSSVLPSKHYKYSEFNHIASSFSDLIERLKNSMRENYEIQISLKNAKLNMMISQLNPHFLFNTLQLLQTEIVYGDPKVSNSIVLSLGNLFRYSTSKTDAIVQIRDEVNFARDYMSICKKHYDDNLSISMDIDESLLSFMTPKFIIQPILENSIKHGFSGTPYKNSISIKGYPEGFSIHFVIEDDGSGMDESHLAHIRKSLDSDRRMADESGIGLKNIHQRIRILFGEQYGIHIESEQNSFTRVHLLIPQISGNTMI